MNKVIQRVSLDAGEASWVSLVSGVGCATGGKVDLAPRGLELDRAGPEALLSQRTLPMVVEHARNNGTPVGPDLAELQHIIDTITSAQLEQLCQVVEELNDVAVASMLLAGADLVHSTYPLRLPRIMRDVDLLVREADVHLAREAIQRLGFEAGSPDLGGLRVRRAPTRFRGRAPSDAGRYSAVRNVPSLAGHAATIERWSELLPRVASVDGNVFLGVVIDLHVNVAENVEPRDLWRSPRRYAIYDGGPEMLAQAPSDLLWHLASRCYSQTLRQGPMAMRSLIDVVSVLHRYGGSVDWERCLELCTKYETHAPFFYVLWHCDQLLGSCTVPDEVLDHCDPSSRAGDRARDWGDPMPRLLARTLLMSIEPGIHGGRP